MEISYLVDEEMYLHFNMMHLKNTPAGKKGYWMQRFLLPFFAVIAIFIFLVARADRTLILCETIALAIMSLIWVAGFDKVMQKSMRKTFRTLKANGKLPFHEKGTILLEEAGVRDVSDDAETLVGYSHIERILADEQGIYIYFSAVQAFLIPASSFAGEAERGEFLAYLARHCTRPVERI